MAYRETAKLEEQAAQLLADGSATRPRPAVRRSKADLHICAYCDSELVYPVDWAPVAAGRWQVALRCPECEWRGAGTFAQSVVDRFDDVLDAGVEHLLEDLKQLTRANMDEQVERFVSALRTGDILPEDF